MEMGPHKLRPAEVVLAALITFAPIGFAMRTTIGVLFWFVAWGLFLHLVFSGWRKIDAIAPDIAAKVVLAVLLTYFCAVFAAIPIISQYNTEQSQIAMGCLRVKRPLVSYIFGFAATAHGPPKFCIDPFNPINA